ncbi:MAG: response regulator transcription factor [Stackebrandtia sp.]
MASADPHARLLVVDDEEVLAELVRDSLTLAGYDVTLAHSGTEAIESVARQSPDLIVLDVLLPDLDGFSVTRRLRGEGDDTPIVYLTACSSLLDLRSGFRAGGDDYLTKPFRVEELCLRVAAVLRRSRREPLDASRLTVSDLVLDADSHQVWRGDVEIELSPTEFKLLHYLLRYSGKVIAKPELLRHVWGYDFAGDTSLVETYVFYLRRKLECHGPRLVHTVRGVGYVLRKERQ